MTSTQRSEGGERKESSSPRRQKQAAQSMMIAGLMAEPEIEEQQRP